MQVWLQHLFAASTISSTGWRDLWRVSPSGEEGGAPGAERSWVLAGLLLSYIACMMLFSVFVRQWATLHHDSTEMAAWGAEFALGYSKHPPFGAWVAGLWFRIMPHANWSFDLLAVLCSALGLAGVWKLAGLFTDERGQRLAMLPLMLTPAFTTWAFKYNANSILLFLWPWTAYFTLRMTQTQSAANAMLAGLLAGLAMLGKYYSIVLLATLGLALIAHPARGRVFGSIAPYLAAVVALAVMAPHVWWLTHTDASTIGYMMEKTQYDPRAARATTLRSLGAGLLTLVLPAIFMLLAFRADWAGLRERLRAGFADLSRSWVVILAVGPFVLTALAHVIVGVRIGGDFLLPAFIAVPLAFVVLHGAGLPALAVDRFTLGAALIVGGMGLLSPLIGAITFATSSAPLLEPRRELALAATDIWRGAIGQPLRQVAGSERHATAIAFFSPDTPRYRDGLRPNHSTSVAREIARDGLLFVCAREDADCIGAAQAILGDVGVRRVAYSGSHSVLGYVGPMYNYELFLLPPGLRSSAR